MFDYLLLLYNYFKLFLGISLFSYIYKICFDSCNEKVNIKTKHNKNKQTIKSRIGLSLIYLFLLFLLYNTITLRVVLTLFCSIALGLVYGLDKFDRETLEIFSAYDKNKAVRYTWKIIYSLVSIFFVVLTPVHNSISETVNKTYDDISKKTKSKFNEHMFGDVLGKGMELGSGIKRALDEMSSRPKFSKEKTTVLNEKSNTSHMSDYIINRETKSKTATKLQSDQTTSSSNDLIITGNQKVIIEETETETETIVRNEESVTAEKVSDEKSTGEDSVADEYVNVEKVKDDGPETNVQENNEDLKIENTNIKPEEESEKLIEILKKMNKVFSHEGTENSDYPSTVEPSTRDVEGSSIVESVSS